MTAPTKLHLQGRLVILKLLKYFRRSPLSDKKTYRSELHILLDKAQVFRQEKRRDALEDLQRLVLRPIQSKHMVDAYLKPAHQSLESIDEFSDLGLNFIPKLNQSLISFVWDNRRISEEKLPVAKLGRDSILPTCWHPSSVLNVLGNIGEGRKCGPWRQDLNHRLFWWYPLNIFWVGGGNHSIMQGILLGEGHVKAIEGYDLSDLYKYVQFDGIWWRDSESNEKLGMPRYKELGYVFEIGRHIRALDLEEGNHQQGNINAKYPELRSTEK